MSNSVLEKGPPVGRYRDYNIPAWIKTEDGISDYVRVTGVVVELSELADDECVIAPGLVYKRREGQL